MSLRTADPTSSAPSARLQKPSWRDPRLLVGLLLVLASVAGVVALVNGADRTSDVYAAKEELAVGTALTAEKLVVVPVRLGDLDPKYLALAGGIPDDAVVKSLVREGELLPASAVGAADSLDRKPVGLTVADPLPSGTAAGDRVDVWISLQAENNAYAEPELLLEAAEISELVISESALGASQSTLVHVLVEDGKLPALLNALSNEARITVVLNPGAAP